MSDNQTLIKNATNATTETLIFGCPKYFLVFSPQKRRFVAHLLQLLPQVRCFLTYFSYLCGVFNRIPMSKFVIYLDVEPYMKQWLTHAYGDPVVFPASSSENAVIRRLTTKRPSNDVPEQPSDRAVAISIPSCKYKSPETYNYLTPFGKQALSESLDDLFRINMWQDLGDLSDTSCTKMSAFRAWCQMHGIDIDYAETIRMKWYRMRRAHQSKGINLFSNERNRINIV